MRRHAQRILFVLLGVVAVVFLALTLKDTRDLLERPGYDATAPTEAKFARLNRWIPPKTEFYVTVDVPRALANPDLRNRLIQMVGTRAGVVADLVSALLQNENSIGLLTMAGTLGDVKEPPEVVVVAQGEFDKETMLPAIRAAMSEGKSGLTSRDIEWSTIYYESDARRPFGFIILDGFHMAVGERAALEAFFLEKPEPPEGAGPVSKEVVFGHMDIGPRIKSVVPRMLAVPESVDFASEDGVVLTAHMPCADRLKAMSLRMFLEGVRSLIMLQHENNAPLVKILEGVTIASEGEEVMLTTKLAPLLDLWEQDLDVEGDYPPGPHVDKPPVRKL